MGKVNGSTISGDELRGNKDLINASKKEAKQYQWLYQCTSVESLISIIKSREIWLSNLQRVNDKEEGKRISVPKYEKSYFVSCFTYEDDIPMEHWKEYGSGENSLLFGFKPEWVIKQAELMWSPGMKVQDKDFKVYSSFEEATQVSMNELKINHRVCNPYFFGDFGFYKIIYDDEIKKKMNGDCIWRVDDVNIPNGQFVTMGLPGIIKNTHGKCERPNAEPYDKDWTTEKEIRLKACIMTNHELLPPDLMFTNMAVKLNEQAFCKLIVRFSPLMTLENQKINLERLSDLVPRELIELLK